MAGMQRMAPWPSRQQGERRPGSMASRAGNAANTSGDDAAMAAARADGGVAAHTAAGEGPGAGMVTGLRRGELWAEFKLRFSADLKKDGARTRPWEPA